MRGVVIFIRFFVVCFVLNGIAACSRVLPKLDQVLPDKRKEYKKSESLPDLEVPPDLTSGSIQDAMPVPDVDPSGSATFSNYQERQAAKREGRALPSSSPAEDGTASAGTGDTATSRDVVAAPAKTRAPTVAEDTASGEQKALVAGGSNQIWPKLTRFWQKAGYPLNLNDRELAVLETAWKTPDRGGRVRERFKLFAEATDKPGKTGIYLTRDAEEKTAKGWRTAARDPVREREVLGRMLDALGGGTVAASDKGRSGPAAPTAGARQAARGGRAELMSSGTGKLYLRVPASMDAVWPKTGAALEGTGIAVEDQDRGRGVYTLRYAGGKDSKEERGFFSRLAFWKSDGQQYKLVLAAMGGRTEIVVLDDKGNWDNTPTANDILSKLRDQLNRG